MVKRKYWLNLIEKLWQKKNVIWLYGVRRAGKTFLCQSIKDIKYFDCELPSIRNLIDDPESFLEKYKGEKIALDEIHKLKNPSELLKIAADYFPSTKIIATGSSVLSASKKFKDTLTGRKKDIWITPFNFFDVTDFKVNDINEIFLKGGLPPFLIESDILEKDYYEWIESYWAKDLNEIYNISKKDSFLKLTELLILRSGGIFEATSYSAPCEISRQTVQTYMEALKSTLVINILRPFHTKKSSEIISAPKVYFFDWGFVNAFKGIKVLRNDDKGMLWEHRILNELISLLQTSNINYWRDKSGHEVDFIVSMPGKKKIAIECKLKEKDFNPKNFKIFLKKYADFQLIVVASDVKYEHSKKIGALEIKFINLSHIHDFLKENNFLEF